MKSAKLIFFLFLFVSSCRGTTDQHWITVFVHGNYGAAWITLDFDKVLWDNCEESLYKKWQTKNRIHTITHKKMQKPRFYPEIGLNKIEGLLKDPIAYAFAQAYQSTTAMIDPQQAAQTTYYSFGWNGLLSQSARRKEAIAFYQALGKEIAYYKAQGISTKIRIICHSHGGNVALNLAGISAVLNNEQIQDKATQTTLAAIKQEIVSQNLQATLDQELYVDELMIFATPIQMETEGLAASKFFKKVFTGYSQNDVIQIIDSVSTKGPISNRRITKQKVGGNTCEIQYSVVRHPQGVKPRPLATIIKNKLKVYLTKGQTIIKQLTDSHVKNTSKPEEKAIDQIAFKTQSKEMLMNMSQHPDDPSHGDFFNATFKKKQNELDTLPLFIWSPLISNLIQQFNECSEPHITFHYYDDETITVVAESAIEEKWLTIQSKTVLNLKKNFVDALCYIKDKSENIFNDFSIDC